MPSILNPPPERPRAPLITPVRVFVTGLILFVLMLAGIFVYGFVTNINRIRAQRAVVDAALDVAAKTPGTAGLRAAGCPLPFVFDDDGYVTVISTRASTPQPAPGVDVVILCNAPARPPDCDVLARAWAASEQRLPGTFLVSVEPRLFGAPACRRSYSASGEAVPQ